MFSPDFMLCSNTSPFSLSVFSLYSTFTTKFLASSADFASASVFPNTFGITTWFTPVPMLTCIFTVSPAFAVVFASVSWLITIPSFIVLLVSSIFSAFNLFFSNASTASSYVIPATFGTVVCSVPLLIFTDTVLFSFTL